ncbi:MAG TPA: twin-arginine translocation signal domain-containing protein [Burkholderiales bacterium]|nr:twin-arginine translocation signal domain-containing protein [Burkholderiales bacterium]
MSEKQSGKQFTRRTFIKAVGTTGATVYVLWSSPAWLGPRIALAANLSALNGTQAKEMLAMTRQLFPHDKLGDEYYWVVVESIDKEMAGSPELKTRIQDGLAQLNEAAGGDFSAVDADKQLEAMTKLESTPFFSDMLNKTQFYFYNNKTVWPKFGYEGSSWEKGGYINRGFNDVRWTDG